MRWQTSRARAPRAPMAAIPGSASVSRPRRRQNNSGADDGGERLECDQDHEEKQAELEDEIARREGLGEFLGLAQRVENDRQRIPAEQCQPWQGEQRRAGELDDRTPPPAEMLMEDVEPDVGVVTHRVGN